MIGRVIFYKEGSGKSDKSGSNGTAAIRKTRKNKENLKFLLESRFLGGFFNMIKATALILCNVYTIINDFAVKY